MVIIVNIMIAALMTADASKKMMVVAIALVTLNMTKKRML